MKHLITVGFLMAAFIMYGLAQGQMTGILMAGILLFVGCIFELTFWARILKIRGKQEELTRTPRMR